MCIIAVSPFKEVYVRKHAFGTLLILIILAFCQIQIQAQQNFDYFILISFTDMKLYLYNHNGELVKSYSVALAQTMPKDLPAEAIVKETCIDPAWFTTPLIRRTYLRDKKIELPFVVETGDPRNAMGKGAITLTYLAEGSIDPLVAIHGTNDESSIGKRVTSGCVRLHNKDILALIDIIGGKSTRVMFDR